MESMKERVRKYYKVSKGEKFALERRKQVADITKEMLESGEEITLKPFVCLSSFIVDTISVRWVRSLRAVICILC